MRHCSLIVALVVCTTASAIGPADFPSAGTASNDGGNAAFLNAVTTLNALYGPAGGSTAGASFSNADGVALPPGSGARLWFVSQDAGYTNAFGVTTGGTDAVAFADSHALASGDQVTLAGGAAISQVNFFSLAGISAGTASFVYHDGGTANADGVTHITTSLPYVHAGSLWYAIALDDQYGGGDRDWNDLRLILQVFPVSTPEPATLALFAGFLAIGAWLWRRQRLALG